MRHRLEDRLLRWLAAERAAEAEPERAEAAEAALAELFAGLDRPAPRPGFARRVVVAAGLSRPSPRAVARRPLPRPLRWGVAAALAAVGALSWWLPLALGRLAGDLGFSGALERLAQAVAAVSHGLAGALAVAYRAASLVAELITTPEAAAGTLAVALAAVLALSLLTQLISRERNLFHASP